MPIESHQILLEEVLTWARECLVDSGRLEFTIFTIDEQGRRAMAAADPACFAVDGGRERLAREMRMRFRTAGIVSYAIAAECWLTRPMAPAGPQRDPQMRRDGGGREEVVIVHVCDRRRTSVHVSAILRDTRTGAAIGLREFITTDDEESLVAGRFNNLLEGGVH